MAHSARRRIGRGIAHAAVLAAGLLACASAPAFAADPSAPTASFTSWTESSPYAWYNAGNDIDRLWFNPNYSGSATARIAAADPDSGISFVTFPTGPAGWNVGGNSTTPGSGNYDWTYNWTAGAVGGTPTATATHGDPLPPGSQQSAPVTVEFVADNTAPTVSAGSVAISVTGWRTTTNFNVTYPNSPAFSDTGSSATGVGALTRLLQYRDGVPDGAGGCDTTAGVWTTLATNPAGTSYATSIATDGVCREFRYRIEDSVGNALNMYASGFRGYDVTNPGVVVTNIAEGTNPGYQKVVAPNDIWYNGLQSGDFTITAVPNDATSGVAQIRWSGLGTWTTPNVNTTVFDPGPWEQVYSWTNTSNQPGAQTIRVQDYAGNAVNVGSSFWIRRDVTAPSATGSTLTYATPAWKNTPSIAVVHSGAMTDTQAGIASYQLQREEQPWVAGACSPFTGVYSNLGAPVYGDPPPNLGTYTDNTVTDGNCYRYRVEAYDHVGIVGYHQPATTAMVDDTDPTGTLNALPPTGSGTIVVGGTIADAMSGLAAPAQVSVRIEDQSNLGVFTTIYTDTSVGTGVWGNYNWNTTALNGTYKVYVDLTDAAGNTVPGAIVHTILLDNSIPTMTFTGFTEGTNPSCQHVPPLTPTTAWVKTNGTCSGDIVATFAPVDLESGIDHITVPAGPAGWSPGAANQVNAPGPWTQTYSWTTGANNFNTRNATATNVAGMNSANVPFTITTDNTNPTGGAVTYPTGWRITSPLPITVTNYTDAGSGIYQQQLLRDDAPRPVGGTCGVATWPGTFSTVVAQTVAGDPNQTLAGTINDATVATGMCYRYRLVATDYVSNSTGTSTTPGAVVHDLVDPVATIDMGTPTSPLVGTKTITGTSDDGVVGPNSGVANVTIRWENLDDSSTGVIGTDNGASPLWAINWNTTLGATPDGHYRIHVDVYDNAGRSVIDIATRDVTIDNSPPTISMVGFTPTSLTQCQYYPGSGTTHFVNRLLASGCNGATYDVEVNADDQPGGLQYVRFGNNGAFYPTLGGSGNNYDMFAPAWKTEFTYLVSAGTLVRTINITARGNTGSQTVLPTTLVLDMVGPTGMTFTGPGGTSSPSYWTNAATINVPFSLAGVTDPDVQAGQVGSGVRAGQHVVSRRETTNVNCAGGWSAWTTISAPGPASPFPDGSTATGTCYQYRIGVMDNVNNTGWFQDITNQIRVDRVNPTGTMAVVPAYVKGTVTLNGTSADNWSGVANLSVRIGAGPATACTPAVAAGWTCNWDTTTAPNGSTTLTLVATDNAGNVVDAATRTTYVDNELPAGTVTLTAGAQPQWQHVVPGPTPKIYVNTAQAGGSFQADVAATDAFSGILDVQTPALGAGWSPAGQTIPGPTGPYQTTYTWTGPAAAGPGVVSATMRDNTLNSATAPFEVVSDTAAPASASIQYAGGPTSVPSITFDKGTETGGSGNRTWRIERDETTLNGPGSCDPFTNTWTTVATDPAASPWTDPAVLLNHCYRYRLVSIDNVDNTVTVTDPESDVVTVEPAGIVIVESGASTDVAEGGATDTYTVKLRTSPAANVTVTIGNVDGQVSVGSTTLTFTPANWNTPQTVTVTAVDDPDDEVPDPHAGTLTHVAASPGDPAYDALAGANVVANVTDNDVSGITLSPSASTVDVNEAGATSDTYTIVLTSRPASNVDIALTTPDGQVVAAPGTVTFTPANWNTPQTVTVTAVNDAIDEAATHPGVVQHAVTSGDALYGALTVPDVTATVTDDDTAGVTLTPASGLTLDENAVGTTASYQVVLTSEPLANVTINVVGDAQATPSAGSLLFTPADWNVPQTVTMTVVDDLVVEGPHTSVVSHAVSSPGDATYAAVAIPSQSIAITDNDVPGIEVTPLGPLAVTEGGATDSYDIRLESQPTADVTITFTTDAQVQPIAPITFTTANWNSYQTITVTAVDDSIDELSPHPSTITHAVTSADLVYDAWAVSDMDVDVTDDDTAGITIDDLGGVQVDEANVAATDTFTVVLDSEPVAPVTIALTPDSQVTVAPAPLTFTPANWNVPQTVTVTVVNDPIDEASPHAGSVSFAAAGDPLYAAITPPPLAVSVLDDDTAGITVSPGTLALDETLPATDTYTIVLDSLPGANVTVNVSPDAQVTTADTTLVFTPATWNVPQTVTVAAVDDPTVETTPHVGQLTHAVTSADTGYAAIVPAPKDADIADNDTPGVTVTESGTTDVAEGGATDSYDVVLDRQPRVGETVTVTVAGDAQATAAPGTLVFDHANWNVVQTVTVTAVDDPIQEPSPHPATITNLVASTDALWATVTSAASVTANVTDDDVAAVTVTTTGPHALSEDTPAATQSYTVVLATQPTSNVTINLTVPGDLNADVSTLTFTPANWSTPQTVNVNAIDDAVTEAPIHARLVTSAIVTGDPYYSALTVPDVQFDVTDNDIPGITVNRVALAATEGGATDSFSVVLETQPTADVTVDLTGTQVAFDVDPLVFTSANWNVPQVVTVTAIDDPIDEASPHAGLVELDVTSADPTYDLWPLTDIPVDVTDNDTAAVTVTPGTTPIAVDETGPTSASYSLVLDTQPSADVTVAIATADGQTTASVPSVTFTAANWNVPQSVTVTAVDDAIDEAATHPGLVTHVATSADLAYDGIAVTDQSVDIADDDTADVLVTPTSGLALDEAAAGTTASFDVVLASQPIAPVTIALATPDGQTTTAPTSLLFTPANWNAPQTVTVTVVDDAIDEAASHTGTVVVTVTPGGDPAYDAIDPADVTADIADDDSAGVVVTETGGSTDVDEASLTDTYAVVLQSQPTGPVDIAITGGPQASSAPTTLTFTPANWSTPQVVTVSGTPDALVEGPHTQLFTHVATSADPNYGGITITDVTANITDDDVAGATITPTNVTVAEGGATATYDVVLDAQPVADVTIAIATADGQTTTSSPSLTFTNATWNVPQTVTVTAVDDLVTEPSPHPGTITHAMSSADPDFNVPVADVTAAITDNDVPGVTITPTSVSVAEGGATDTYDVVLDTNPGVDVTVTFAEPGQLLPIAPLTFTTANWNVPQPVTVTAFDDFVMEGAHTTTVTVDTASAAPAYDTGALTISPVDVDIADNDTAGVLLAPSSGLAGSEGGPNITYAMSLTSEPVNPITITLAGDADGAPVGTSYTFTPANWATPQNVDVAIVQDAIAEGAHTTTVSGTINAGADSFYGAVTVPDQVIDIADDDTAGVTFTPAAPGPLTLAEGGATATYDVVLTSEPTANVTITGAALGGQATTAPGMLTFTPANWNVPQVVTVTAVDDPVDETTPHPDTIAHAMGGGDPTYAALVPGDMDLAIDDNDSAGVRIDLVGPDTTVTEGGAGDTVTVVLESQPIADVDVTLTPDAQVTLGSPTLTFTTANWNVPQVVTVDAVDDAIDEGPHTGAIDALTSSIGDPTYAGLSATQHVVTIVDDDTAGVVVTQPAATDLDEAAPLVGQTYQVRLATQPTGDVDVLIAPDAQVSTAPATLTFTTANWNVDQTVTAYPVDDAVAEADPHPGVVSHDTTSADPKYGTGVLTIPTVTLDIADNDTPGIQVSPTAGHAVAEGGATSAYDVVLLSQPTAPVTFTPVSTQLDWSVPSITFTSLDWNIPQTVTLRAIDDSVDEPDPHPGTLDMTVTTMDLGYAVLVPATVNASITDNDTSDLVVTPATGLTVDEAGVLPAATYTLTLTSMPSAPVTVTVTPDAQVAASVPNVVLDGTNWNTGVTVDVTAIDDAVDEANPHPGTLHHDMASADPNFDAEAGPDEVVDVLDDDAAGVTITPSGPDTTVAEDGSVTDTYDVVLTSQPTADVTIDITPDAQVAVAPTSLVFTSVNWNVPQAVNVTAVDDPVIEGPHTGTIQHAATSADTNYQAIAINDEIANVLDDDVAGVLVTPAGGSFQIAEGGSTDTINIQLATQPVAPVTIDLTPDAQATLSVPSVTLDSSNWNTGVDVTVTAVDDGFIEASPHPAVVALAVNGSSDPAYVGYVIPNAVADVTDNDAASVLVDDLGGITLDEANVGATDTFEVRLGASPAVGETVTVNVSGIAAQLTTAPASLTFDDSNWNTPQTVTVTVVDDSVDEADPHTSPISFTTTSADTNFDALTVADVDATIADDDAAGLVLDTTTVTVDEAGPTSQVVQVHLASQPLGTVEVAIASDAQVTFAPAGPLTFDNANWSVDQAITITAVDDPDDEASPHAGITTLTASSVASADPTYDALAPVDVTADITDNDTSDVTITPTGGVEVDEANPATTMTWDVVLDTRPSGNVTVTLLPDAQVAVVGPTVLTFTPANWNVPQQAELRANDDPVDESDPHPGLLAFGMGGTDALYTAVVVPAITVDVRDDDTAGVTVTQSPVPQPLAEDGSVPAATYDVVLDTQPASDVTVTLAPDAQVAVGAPTLTFTPANWNVPQTVTVTAVDDPVTEPSPHTGTVVHTSDSLDPAYALVAALPIVDATFDIADDDVPSFHFAPASPAPSVDEANVAATATYDLYIDTVPAGPVTVNFASTGGDVTISPSSHTFTAGNFATPVTITVTAVDDHLPEADPHTDTITHLLDPTSDPSYLPVTIPDVTASVADDDVAQVLIDDLGGVALDEAAVATTDTFEVRLAAQPLPGNPVTVALATPDGQTTVAPASLTFDDTDWNAPQTVTVTVVDDPVTESTPHPGAIQVTTTSTDVAFDALVTPDVVAQIADDDVPGFVIVDPSPLTMDEADVVGTERTMTIALATAPPTPVTINVGTGPQLGLQSLPTLTFDNLNWNVPQSVVVRAIDDLVAEASPHPGVLTFAVAPTSDPLYAPLTITDRTFDITDDDLANVAVTCAPGADWNVNGGGNVDLSETPADATHDVVCAVGLGTMAAQDVTVDITTDPTQVTVDVPSVVIPAGTNGPVNVTFTAVDDAIDEANPHASVAQWAISSADPIYDAETMPDTTFDIVDDDTVGVTVTQVPAPQPLAEDGSLPAATYDVVLDSQPTADVTVTLTPDGQVDAGGTTTLTFTTANWNVPQTVTVTAVDDAITESSPHTGTIAHVATSADTAYDGIAIVDATFDIADDDVPSFHFVPATPAPAVDEANVAATATYELWIDTIPGSPVTVDLAAAGGDVTVSPSSYTFDSLNWSTAATITVTAVDDPLVEGPHTDTISHVVNASSDPGYLAVTIPDVTVDVADDDFATIVTDDLGGVAVDEGAPATTATFTVALGAQPTANVDVSVTPDAQTTVDLPLLTFTSANWNVPQTVTVTVVDDSVVEASPHPGAITFGSTSADTTFDALVAPDVVAQITDDDTPSWVVTPPASTSLDEADPTGTAQTFQVALGSQPAPGNAVTLSLLADPQVELDPSTPGPLVFDDSNWNVPQLVTVRAIDDQAVEATPHPGVLSFDASASTEPTYAALPLAPIAFDVDDDDTPGVTFTPAAPGPLAIAEAGATATYTVVLDKQPLTDVTVDITAPDGQSTVDLPTLTFTSATWNVPQTVTVTAVDDSIAEGAHVGHLHHVVGGDPAWTGVTPADMDLDIADDDTAGVTVTQVGAPQPLDEAGTLPAATYTVELDSEPTADVTLTPTVDTQVLASPATLTFTNADWNVPQTITVTAVQDTIVEADPHPGKVTHDTASTDPAYDTGVLTIADADFSITDDDAAGFTVTPLAPAAGVDEANVAATASYDISIDTVPTGTVTVDLTTGPDVSVAPATLTFTSANAGTPQTVTVTAIDDPTVEGPETEQVVHAVTSASDPAYDLFVIPDVAVDVADDDVAGVATDDGGGIALDEAAVGTTGTVDVSLTAQPAGTVTVDVATPDGQTTVAPATLTFDGTNWNTPQPVTVTVVDDALSEGPHTGALQFTTTSAADPAFDALTVPDVTVDIADDDVAAIVVTPPSPALLDEANSAATAQTLTVTLATSPVTPVTVLGVSDGQVTVSPNPVVLDSSNWNTGVPVSIAAVDDAIAELDPHPGIVDFQVVDAMSDPAYAGLVTGPQAFQITDDDAAAATIQCLPGADWNINGGGHLDMAEATAAPEHDVQCDIVLGTAPAADVTVDITTTPSADVTVSPASVTIPAGTNAPVTVTFTATDDQVAQGTHPAKIDFAITSTDPIYGAAAIPSVDVDIADDDVAGVLATPAGPLTLAEGGASATVDVVLTSQPTASVDVAVNGAPQVAATPGTLTFTTSNWNVPQTITVSAIDDSVDEPDPHPGLLTFAFTSADAAYAAAAVTPIAVSITDNDTPGVVIATTNAGNTVAEGGATDTFTMQLGTQPTANVDVTVAGDAQVGVAPATVTFTPTDWNTPQTVTLTAVQDQVVEGDHTGNITFSLASGDVSYVTGSSATPAAQPVAITDDDLAGIDVVESDGSTKLTEAGQTDTYTVVLKGQPTADVAIAIDGGTQVTGAPAGLTFTPANWNTPQTVTLTAVQDSIDETDPHPGEVKHVVTTSAAGWTGALVAGITSSITDDDSAQLIVEQTDGTTAVTEGAKTGDVITLRLSSEPVSDVSVIPTGDQQVEVGGGTVILGKDNWRTPTEVPVTAIDDDDFEGDHEGVVTFKVSSDDPSYSTATANAVIVAVTDNEVDDGIGGTGGDDETGTRTPRTGTPPASTRPGSKTSSTSSRRTSEGASRTTEGSTRLPAGVDSSSQSEGDGVRKGTRLGGEVTAAKEEEAKAERKGPFAAAAKWLGDHWKLWVPLLALGMVLAGVGAYMLRSDPARAAQKAAGKAGDGRLAAGGRKRSAKDAKGKNKPRRMRRGGKKDDDDEDEDGAPGARPNGRRG